ncbi:hypothetical protein EIP91_002337 [Steccherinum ochraceum]|uniref:Ceramide glucosyltransferase n=1 Tax=Steccherinum ochraceum TaxID=92696 RepID=A0A4R0RT19_9APHY|nr:hypothetical protein EIP91_002337 [Steccherinum ochraceum]
MTVSEGLLYYVPLVLAIICLVWYTILWSLGLLGCRTARRRYRSRPRSPLASADPSSVPGVSILRPLKGLDPNLYENLESTFTQEYPNFEIFLCVESEHDQALGVVRELVAKYPRVNAHIFIGAETVGTNPKINNLIRAYRQAANDILWVLDSNVSAAPGTLARSVDILAPPPRVTSTQKRRIALVHHVPLAYATEHTLGSRIEEAFLNTNHAKMYLAINTVGLDSCVVGKSNLYRKSDLERVDGTLKPHGDAQDFPHGTGLAAFGRFLAEDNMIGQAVWKELDLRHDLSCDVARTSVGSMSFYDYILRRIRWLRLRRQMLALIVTIVEPFTESVFLGSLTSISLYYLFSIPVWFFLPVHFVLWITVDVDVYASLAGHPVAFEPGWWPFLGAWVLRECLAFPIWFYALWGSDILWRGKTYAVTQDGEVTLQGNASGRPATNKQRSVWHLLPFFRTRNDHYEPLELAHD